MHKYDNDNNCRHSLSLGQIWTLTIVITIVLFNIGMVTVNVVQAFDPLVQNLIYAIGRIPILFTILYFFLED